MELPSCGSPLELQPPMFVCSLSGKRGTGKVEMPSLKSISDPLWKTENIIYAEKLICMYHSTAELGTIMSAVDLSPPRLPLCYTS